MAEQKKKRKRLAQKLLDRYRLVIINETTFEEQSYFRLSRLNVIILATLILFVVFVLSFLTIAYTPLQEFVPGKSSAVLRQEAIKNRDMLDSITVEHEIQARYINALRSLMVGEVDFINPSLDSLTAANDTLQITLLPTNSADSMLRQQVAQEDKYNILNTDITPTRTLFFPPAKGPISQGYDLNKKHFAVDVVLKENTPIKAIAPGIVIFAEWTAETGYVIMIEHQNSMLSIYKHNATLTKQQGELVTSGEVIATAGNTGEYTTGFHLHFELWSEGYPLNPIDVIDFSEN
jgi:murein DD-endopeptidase MepM/ murein hydrolase activator NlpD